MIHWKIILSSLFILFLSGIAGVFLRQSMLGIARGVLLSLKILTLLSAILYLDSSGERGTILLVISLSSALLVLLYTLVFCALHIRAARFGGTANIDVESGLKN